MRTTLLRPRMLFAILLVGLGAACTDATGPQELEPIKGQVTPGIYPTIAIPAAGGEMTKVEVHLRRANLSASMVSYQGEINYRSDLLTIDRAESAPGVTGSWNEPEPGRLRFAGASLDGIDQDLVVTFIVKGTRAIKPSDFRLSIEEIIGADKFENITHLIVRT